jgi:hypothetical protein
MFLRFFFSRVTLAARFLATGNGGQPDISLVATPALRRLTMPLCFFFGRVAASTVRLASRL